MASHSRPTAKLTGSQHSMILGFLSIYACTLCYRTSEFDEVTHVMQGRVSWGQTRLPSQESRVLGLRHFGVFFPYLCLHPLTQNDQIWHGRVFSRSAMPLHLYKCVTRFVSDSWVSYRFLKTENRFLNKFLFLQTP